MFSGQIEFEPLSDAPSSAQILTWKISDRLCLRSLKLSDTAMLFALVEANRDYLRQWLPWLDSNQTAADTQNFIQSSLEQAQNNNGFVTAIVYEAQLVGVVGLNYINWHNRSSGLGYWLAEPYQGTGIVTDACRVIINYSFNSLNLNRIDIRCASQNGRSRAVAQRLGLAYEGTLRDAEWLCDHFVDHRVYSVLRREW